MRFRASAAFLGPRPSHSLLLTMSAIDALRGVCGLLFDFVDGARPCLDFGLRPRFRNICPLLVIVTTNLCWFARVMTESIARALPQCASPRYSRSIQASF